MVPTAVTPPTVRLYVSEAPSSMASCVVGVVIVKLVTPAGTIRLPPTRVTPPEKVGGVV